MDSGISEEQFWNMTIAEIKRAVESKNRVEKLRMQERAAYDYKLAICIARGVNCVLSDGASMPDIGTVYPTLFDTEDIEVKRKEKQDEISALRFKQFANSFNKKFVKEGATQNG